MDRKFLGKQGVSDKVLGQMIGNAMSQNVLERLFINLLPFAGLVAKGTVLEDRWLARTNDPKWPRSKADVKKIALKPKETPTKRKIGKAGRVPAGKKRRLAWGDAASESESGSAAGDASEAEHVRSSAVEVDVSDTFAYPDKNDKMWRFACRHSLD